MLLMDNRNREGYRSQSRDKMNGSRDQVYRSRNSVYSSREQVNKSQDQVNRSQEKIHRSQDRVYGSQDPLYEDRRYPYDTRSLPRSKRSREESQFGYGSLPRTNKQYGEGNSGNRGRGMSKAPSQRRIDKQREMRRDTYDRQTRASSVPKQGTFQTILPVSKSMMSIWTPGGKCPSFADMLKGSQVSEETLHSGICINVPDSTKQEEVKVEIQDNSNEPIVEKSIETRTIDIVKQESINEDLDCSDCQIRENYIKLVYFFVIKSKKSKFFTLFPPFFLISNWKVILTPLPLLCPYTFGLEFYFVEFTVSFKFHF